MKLNLQGEEMKCIHKPQGICRIENCTRKGAGKKCNNCGKPRWCGLCQIHRPDGTLKPRRRGGMNHKKYLNGF